ncbi:hypothetical protein H2200_001316 [Cladophialophora chaetospira]|uniref:Uncharacterized protein n=1 Tax=Cladophialophora chaetospira TaxID=386627 RepID=A0AA38XKN4_9EURO|nr:hypothetical protein H2200_001316 [Cladophialophora chaetospira]
MLQRGGAHHRRPRAIERLVGAAKPTASIRALNFASNEMLFLQTCDIPSDITSTEALGWIGFDNTTAAEIFERYIARPDPTINPADLLQYVYGHISRLLTSNLRNLPRVQAMRVVGLNKPIRRALLDPCYDQILWTQDLHFWVKDTLKINYATLMQLQQQLGNYIHQRRSKQKQKPASVHGMSVVPPPAAELRHWQPEHTATVNMIPEDHNLPASHVTVSASPPTIREGHLMLYKGRAATESINQDGPIADDGSISMEVLSTCPGGDFNWTSPAQYWTPEKDVAEQFRRWAEQRCPYSETWLLAIQLSPEFARGLKREELWFSRDWKEYAWYCKKTKQPLSKFNHFWNDPPAGADLMEGHICTGVTTAISRMKVEEIQDRIDEDHVLQVGENETKAKQCVFLSAGAINRLGREMRGKLHIDIYAAIQSQEFSEGLEAIALK